MNILFISVKNAYLGSFGGAETSMKLMAEELAKKGHQVFYISKDRKRGFFPGLKRKRVNGVDVFIFKEQYKRRRMQFLRSLDKSLFEKLIRWVISKNNIEVVYCYYELSIIRHLFNVRSVLPDFKIVMRMAGMHWYERSLKKQSAKERFIKAFNQVDAINYIHRDQEQVVREKLKELGMKVSFKYSFAADIGFSGGLKRLYPYGSTKHSEFRIINAARFSDYQKRQDLLVKAAALISPEIKIYFKLIGEGEEKEKIQGMIDTLGLGNRVTLLSFMSQEELWREMIAADLMCHACDYEGLGKIIIESMALGLPVLASDVATINGYIEDGINGFMVENEPELWARKIETLIEDQHARIEVSRKSIEYVEENYSSHKNVAQYEYHFQKILDNQ